MGVGAIAGIGGVKQRSFSGLHVAVLELPISDDTVLSSPAKDTIDKSSVYFAKIYLFSVRKSVRYKQFLIHKRTTVF